MLRLWQHKYIKAKLTQPTVNGQGDNMDVKEQVAEQITSLIEKFRDQISPQDFSNELISFACLIAFKSSQNILEGVQHILQSFNESIDHYQKFINDKED